MGRYMAHAVVAPLHLHAEQQQGCLLRSLRPRQRRGVGRVHMRPWRGSSPTARLPAAAGRLCGWRLPACLVQVRSIVPPDLKFVIEDITDGDPRKVGITWWAGGGMCWGGGEGACAQASRAPHPTPPRAPLPPTIPDCKAAYSS